MASLSADWGYLRGQVDRLQHEVQFLETASLLFLSLLALSLGGLLFYRNRQMQLSHCKQ